jgi:hypothetical protein
MANMSDCLSGVLRLAAGKDRLDCHTNCKRSICIIGGVPVFQTGGECSNHSCCSKMPGSVMVNISHFDCDVPGSNPGLVSGKTLALA